MKARGGEEPRGPCAGQGCRNRGQETVACPPPWREREREGGGPDIDQREGWGGDGRDGAYVGGDDHRNHGRWIPGTGDDRGSQGTRGTAVIPLR